MTQIIRTRINRAEVIEDIKTTTMKYGGASHSYWSSGARYTRALHIAATSDFFLEVGDRLCPIKRERVVRIVALFKNTRMEPGDYKTACILMRHLTKTRYNRIKMMSAVSHKVIFSPAHWTVILEVAKKLGFKDEVGLRR